MVCWLLGKLGCLAASVICWVFSRLRHVVRCLHPLVCAVAFCCMLCDVTSVSTPVFAAIPREGGGGWLALNIFVLAAFYGTVLAVI